MTLSQTVTTLGNCSRCEGGKLDKCAAYGGYKPEIDLESMNMVKSNCTKTRLVLMQNVRSCTAMPKGGLTHYRDSWDNGSGIRAIPIAAHGVSTEK
jgi:hypothetical protein